MNKNILYTVIGIIVGLSIGVGIGRTMNINSPLAVGHDHAEEEHDHSSHEHNSMEAMAADYESLKAAKDVDLTFIDLMIPHHEMAVAMADYLMNTTKRPEMKTFAEQIKSAQSKEIEMMKQWKQEWTTQ